MAFREFCRRIVVGLWLAALCGTAAFAQTVAIPGFWDPNAPAERPELAGQGTVRFLTDDSFPPLHFTGIDRIPTGFSVELARAACDRLQLSCTIQSRRFDNLLEALSAGQGDAIAAAIPINATLRQSFAVTSPYFRNPARFAVRKSAGLAEPSPQALRGRRIGAVAGTVHEAYLQRFFPGATVAPFADLASATGALQGGEIDYLFADGLNLALWIAGSLSGDCCTFSGGPYLENRYFGEGIGFVFRPEDATLRRAFDYALFQLWKEGKYAELYLQFFPVSPY